MECNKDDAIKAREIAVRKFNDKDIEGAKKFAVKAHNLYPGLEGISQMLATLDVYASAENRTFGEADWYGVLGVPPQADDDTVRKQYRKLALMLHPDKNKSIGAEGAFKLVSEAWSVMSDNNRRATYDAKRKSVVLQLKAKVSKGDSFMPPGGNGFYNFAKTTTANAKLNKNVSHANGSTSGSTTKTNTFWTGCPRCNMQYEYIRTYVNHNLLCPNCRKTFFAIESQPPNLKSSESSKPRNSAQHGQNSHKEARKRNNSKARSNTGGFDWVPFSGDSGAASVAHAANFVQQTYEKVRRVREEAQATKKKAMKRKKFIPGNMVGSPIEKKKRRSSDDVGMNNNQMGQGAADFGMTSSLRSRHGDFGSLHTCSISKLDGTTKLSQIELQNMLMHKTRKEISKKLKEWKSDGVGDAAAQKATEKFYGKDIRESNAESSCDAHDPRSMRAADTGIRAADFLCRSGTPSNSAKEITDQLSVPVPDPDFYDFDKDRTEGAFEENQVWAVYDSDDGMPRYYVMAHSVISCDPFRLRISWLSSNTNSELGPVDWVSSGFTKTCGDFRIARHKTYNDLNCFSHKVRWTKGRHGAICIFPRKGDVWALYRNWSPDWNELTGFDVIHKYEIVEVLEDYNELGVVVIPLVKVAGCKAVFLRHLDPNQVRRIAKREIFRFSHQVPSHLLSGQEAPNAPKGCRQLDPAALPVDFLQVIADVEEDIMEDQETMEEDTTIQDDKKSIDVISPVPTEETKKELTKDILRPLNVEIAQGI